MPIKKQEFYEGAALHVLAQTGSIRSIDYVPPFFLFNQRLLVLFKYCRKNRSPWGFTFAVQEQEALVEWSSGLDVTLALVCGADGIAAVDYSAYVQIASPRKSAVHVACYRQHGKHFELYGPDGKLGRKIAPSKWQKILQVGGMKHEALRSGLEPFEQANRKCE